jgi:hypothetical protein
VPPATSGVEANAPKDEPAGSSKRQRTPRLETFFDEIAVASTARVLLRFPFGCSQSPALAGPAVRRTAPRMAAALGVS